MRAIVIGAGPSGLAAAPMSMETGASPSHSKKSMKVIFASESV